MFIRLLIIIVIICMILLLGSKINEKFTDFSNQLSRNLDPIKLSVESNKAGDRLILKWPPVSGISPTNVHYFIVMYKNHVGPFIITLPHLSQTNVIQNNVLTYEFNDVKMNVEYRFGVFAKLKENKGISKIDIFTKVKKTPPGLQVEYVNDSVEKILCNPDYGYNKVISKNCKKDPHSIQAQVTDDDGNYKNFNYNYHDRMMRELNYNPKIRLNFK